MRGDARGLVDHHDVVVIVHDAELRHRDGNDPRLLLRPPLDGQPAAGAQAVGLAENDAVESDAARLGHLRRERAREAEHLRQRGIHAASLEPVGNGQTAGLHAQASGVALFAGTLASGESAPPASAVSSTFSWSRSRVPSNRRPSTTRSATAIMPVTMKMSATLKIAGIIQGMEIMSTTWPTKKPGSRNSRSVRLPSTPP